MFSDLPVSGIATRVLLSPNLNQYWKSMWMVMFWGPSPSFVAFYPPWLFHSKASQQQASRSLCSFISLDWTSLSRGGREKERTLRVNEMASPCSHDLLPQLLWITFKTLFFMPWAGKSVFPHSFSLSNLSVYDLAAATYHFSSLHMCAFDGFHEDRNQPMWFFDDRIPITCNNVLELRR